MYMVFVAYSMLIRQLDSSRSRGWAHTKLKTIGEACVAVKKRKIRAQVMEWKKRGYDISIDDFKFEEVTMSL